MIIVGGLGSVSGAVYGAAFIDAAARRCIDRARPSAAGTRRRSSPTELPAVQHAAFGLVIVLFLVFEPRGLARIWHRIKDYFRFWPFRY